MEKIYRVQMNAKGMPNFSTAVEIEPYEEDYKMWLEEALISMNPDWVCDGMHDTEFTRDWCSNYCGKDDLYITPKCLHMYYHHIAKADRKAEQTERSRR